MALNLSENALKVLERRYLKKDEQGKVVETPEEMFRRVARAIAQADRLYGHSTQETEKTQEEFYNMMSNLEFMPNTPTLVNAGRELGQLSACFSPKQIIITKDGPKLISQIKVGDYVLTHQDRFRKVTEVFMRKADSIYSISAYKLPTSTLKITAEHPILAIKKEDKNKSHPDWIRVKDLAVGDYIALAFPKEVIDVDVVSISDFIKDENIIEKNGFLYEENRDIRVYIRKDGSIYTQNRNRSGDISKQVTPIKNKIKVDEDLLRLFGYYLSEGCVSESRVLRFVFSLQERDYAKDVLNIVKNKFGISSCIEETDSADRKWLSLRFHSKILAQFFINLFGTGYNIKKIPQWIVLLPKEKQKGLLSGMFRGDSCTVKNGNNFCTQLVMCNRQLVYSAWQILARIEVFAGLNFNSMPKLGRVQPVRCRVSGREGTKLINELLEEDFLHNGIEFKREFIHMGRIFTPITKIIKQDYDGIVYNLEVEEDHSYCANMVSVHNCFVIPIDDSMVSIFEAVKSCALIHRTGGGTGMSFSRLRPKDSIVKTTGGLASGPVSFMKVFDAATYAVRQGGVRRGANMGILRIDHPDILEFITCKESDKEIINFNISVGITDDFMQRLEKDQDYDLIDPHTQKVIKRLNTKEVFDLIVKQAHKNGEPGVVFIDRMNKFNPTPQLGMIESTNPCGEVPLLPYESCLARDSRITTDRGLESIQKLYERQRKGEEIFIATPSNTEITFRPAKIIYIGKKPVFRIKLANGQSIRLTEDHRVCTTDGFKQVRELCINKDRILIQNKIAGELKFSVDGKDENLYQMFGWFTGDGWFTDKKTFGLTFGPEDKDAFDRLVPIWQEFTETNTKIQEQKNFVRCISTQKDSARQKFLDLGLEPARAPQRRLPLTIFTAPKQLQIAYLQGVFCAESSTLVKKPQLHLSSASLGLLQDVQLVLLNLGIYSNIKYYPVRERGRSQGQLRIYGESLAKFNELIGLPLSPKKQQRVIERLRRMKRSYKQKLSAVVVSIEPDGIEDVYDVYEPVTHTLIAEGMVVHNCNLGSINLFRMAKKINGKYQLDWQSLREVVRLGVHFLDNVIDSNKFPLPEIEKNTQLTRKIGLGIMGWASLLVRLGIPYNSQDALDLANRVMGFILEEAKIKSIELAKKRGVFPAYKGSVWEKEGFALRNATLTTIAPTGTISIIAGPCSSGIEPYFAIVYYREVMDKDKLWEVDPIFEETAKEQGFWSEGLMRKIAEKNSIQEIEEIPEDIKRIFVTAHDIAPQWHVKMQAIFQRFTHNSVSKTINFPYEATVEDVRKAYLLAYELGCKGITIYRDRSREEQVLNIMRKEKEEKTEKPESKILEPGKIAPRPRPEVVTGTTTKVATGCGNLYVTINIDEQGRPFELFTQMGKAGGCAASQLEAIGRLVSLAFRSGIEVKSIIEQLRNIRCPSPSWEKGQRIFSCADAIARVIEQRLPNSQSVKAPIETPTVPMKHSHEDETVTGDIGLHGDIVGVCPDCGGALHHEEGCSKCYACGYSKC